MVLLNSSRTNLITRISVIALTLLSAAATAQSVKIEGLIKGRSGEKMIVQTSADPNLIVVLTDTTEVGQVQGMLQARKKEMSMAALIPGLQIKAEGTYNEQHHLVAEKVSFKGNDLQRAQAIDDAGMHLRRRNKTSSSRKSWRSRKQPCRSMMRRSPRIRPLSMLRSRASANWTITTSWMR